MVLEDNQLMQQTPLHVIRFHQTECSIRESVNKAVSAKFDQDHASSDGGVILPKGCDERLQLSRTLVGCLSDERQQSKVTHSLTELSQQRRL